VRRVSFVRRLLAQRHLAVLICAAALVLKLMVPTGYMIASSHGSITITICSGSGPATMTMEMPGMDHSKPEGGKIDAPCAFAGLSAPAVDAIDPLLLAGLIAFVMALGLAVALLPAPSDPVRLRPPLRAPPFYR
jgi:hypothetical protein